MATAPEGRVFPDTLIEMSARPSVAHPAPTSTLNFLSASGMSPGLVVLVLSVCLGIQPVTTDLYLPALPALAESFAAPMAAAQYTLSALLLAFGLSQLVWGPLSDRFGRRPIMLLGLGAYGLAAVGSSLAPSMAWLIGLRVLQGAAMGAVVMCARAIVRDLYNPTDGARVMSKGLSGLGVIACLSAPVGSLLANFLGWRAALLAPALFAAMALAVVALRFKESLTHPDAQALQPARLGRTWLAIVRHPTFLAFSALSVASYGALFTYLATSSFVFIKVLGLSTLQYGLVMFFMSLSYVAGTFLCRYLLARMGVRRAVAIAGGLSLAGGGLLGVLAWAGVQSIWAVMLPFFVVMLAHGIHQPCGQSGAIGPFPQAAGTASALNGFAMMLVAFCIGTWLGTHMDGTTHPLTYGVAAWSVVIALVAWTVVQRQGRRVA